MKDRVIYIVAAALICLFPAITLTVRGGVNGCFLGLLLMALIHLAGRTPRPGEQKIPLWFVASFLVYPLAILVQFTVTGKWHWRSFDAPARFLLAAPIIFLLPRLRIDHLKLFQAGCIAGAIGAFLLAVYSLTHGGEARARTFFTNPVPFGCISLVLALMSCGPVKEPGWRKALALAGFLAGLAASYLSQSRSALLVLPVAAGIWAHFYFDLNRQAKLLVLLGALTAVSGLYAGSDMMKHRYDIGVAELLDSSRQETSIGTRKQLWTASLYLGWQNPVLGVGKGGFQKSLQGLVEANVITADAAMHTHAHNEMLFVLSESGVPGLVGLILLYLGPLHYFWKFRRATDRETRAAAVLGITLICTYAIYGVVDSMFTLSMQTAFYALCVVTLFAHVESRRT